MRLPAPDPAGGAYSAPPNPLTGFGGEEGREGEGRERRKGRKGEGRSNSRTKILATALTDRRTDCQGNTALCIASRAKNTCHIHVFFDYNLKEIVRLQ